MRLTVLIKPLIVLISIFNLLFSSNVFAENRTINLTVEYKTVNFTGKLRKAIAVNNQIPAPTLHFKEGDHVTINVYNKLDEETAIHWHGMLVPWQMDGVLGVTQQGIQPGKMFKYHFTLMQSGTYWYHAHAGLQEQQGLYGAFLIDPSKAAQYKYTKDYVVVLSDWSNTDPDQILANLKKEGDYYAPNFPLQPSLAKFIHDYRQAPTAERKKLIDDYKIMQQMRMSIYDLSDVAYDAFLLNGQSNTTPWTAPVKIGDIVRLRFIGAGGSSIFRVKIPGTTMQMVHIQGNDVKPYLIEDFSIAPGETYDVLVRIQKDHPYIIYAESRDTVGAALGALVTKPNQFVEYKNVVPFPEPLPVTREMMAMMMGKMEQGSLPMEMQANKIVMNKKMKMSDAMNMSGMSHDMTKKSSQMNMSSPSNPMKSMSNDMSMKPSPNTPDDKQVQSMGMDANMNMDSGMSMTKGNTPAVQSKKSNSKRTQSMGTITNGSMANMSGMSHSSMSGMSMGSMNQSMVMNQTMEMPTEPTIIGDSILPPNSSYSTSIGTKYQNVIAAIKTNDPNTPVAGVIKMELFGYMDRYIWFINGVPEYKAHPIILDPGKRYRFVFTNTSMMHHPMHIHGHWFILRKGNDAYDPLLHTIDVPPGATITADVDTDASGQWFFHCHLLYHMTAGMSRVFQYSTLIEITKNEAKPEDVMKETVYHNRPIVRVDEAIPIDASLVKHPMAHPAGLWLATFLDIGVDPFNNAQKITYKGLYGPDYNKLELFMNDAEMKKGTIENADIDIFYWRLISQFWAVKGGVNYFYRPATTPYWQPGIGIEGLMPYFIDTDIRGYYYNGSVKLDLELSRDTQITNNFFIRAGIRSILASKSVTRAEIGSGLNQMQYTLRPYYRVMPGLDIFAEYEHEQDYGALRNIQSNSGKITNQNTLTFGITALF